MNKIVSWRGFPLSVGMLVGLMIVTIQGCNKQEMEKASREANATTYGFMRLMQKGQTTRAQEQAFITAMAALSLQVDREIRGTDKANQTRTDATSAIDGPSIQAPPATSTSTSTSATTSTKP